MLNDKMKDINCTNWVVRCGDKKSTRAGKRKSPNDIYVFFISNLPKNSTGDVWPQHA